MKKSSKKAVWFIDPANATPGKWVWILGKKLARVEGVYDHHVVVRVLDKLGPEGRLGETKWVAIDRIFATPPADYIPKRYRLAKAA